MFGLILGLLLGLLNLVFIDTNQSSTLKLRQALQDDEEGDAANSSYLAYTIAASDAARNDATRLTVSGPDVQDGTGLVASMRAALTTRGCNIVEIHATTNTTTKRDSENDDDDDHDDDHDDDDHEEEESDAITVRRSRRPLIHDLFYVVDRDTGEAFDDDDLEGLAQGLLDATRTPIQQQQTSRTAAAALHKLEHRNTYQEECIQKLERLLYEKRISVVSASGEKPPSRRHLTRRRRATTTKIAQNQ